MTQINRYSLPNEVYVQIFGYLNIVNRIKIIKSSRHFRFLISILNSFKQITTIVSKMPDSIVMIYKSDCSHDESFYNNIHSIICHGDKIIIDIGDIYCYADNRFNILSKVDLKFNDQFYLNPFGAKVYFDKQLMNYWDHRLITVSKLHVIRITALGTRIYASYKSEKLYLQKCNRRKFTKVLKKTYYEMRFPLCQVFRSKNALMAACDSNENIYILNVPNTIDKYDYNWNHLKCIFLDIQAPGWISISHSLSEVDRLIVCNQDTLYICDLDGIKLFKIDSIFTDLRCLTFDYQNNILVVDGHKILRICV